MKQNTFLNSKGDHPLDKHAFLLMPYGAFSVLCNSEPARIRDHRWSQIWKHYKDSQQAHDGIHPPFCCPTLYHCFFLKKARSIRMSWTHLNLHQVLNDTKRPKKWPWSLSGDNLMLTQVTYMHELPREYYKSECNEVLNWIRQMLRLCAILTLPLFGQSGLGKLWGKDETCA